MDTHRKPMTWQRQLAPKPPPRCPPPPCLSVPDRPGRGREEKEVGGEGGKGAGGRGGGKGRGRADPPPL